MELRDYLRVLRGRWRLIVLCTLLAVGAAAAATFASTPLYQARAQLFVSTTQTATDNVGTLAQGNQFAQQRVRSYADIINSPMVTEAVVEELGLTVPPRRLGSRIEATAPIDTVLINVNVTDESPQLAQAIANAVASRFTAVVDDLETPEGTDVSPVKVSVVRAAELPQAPVSPRPALNLALGLLVGLAVGVGAAVLRETLDTSLKGATDVQDTLGLASLGMIGFDADSTRRPLIVHLDPQSTRAEAFRQLRTNLRFVDVDTPPRSIVVTSALPGEGKSTTACNLAIALTQAGTRVTLIEADLRRPRLAQYLGLEGAIGLTDVLIGRADVDDVVQPWGDGTLRVLASGPTPPNPSELLGSHQMGDLLRQLEETSDLVIIDAPPLLPVTDGAVLAKQASGSIVVLRAGRTTREQAARAVEILRGVDAHVYGAVLNMVPTKGPDAYKYGYYGYGYGPDGSQAGPGKKAAASAVETAPAHAASGRQAPASTTSAPTASAPAAAGRQPGTDAPAATASSPAAAAAAGPAHARDEALATTPTERPASAPITAPAAPPAPAPAASPPSPVADPSAEQRSQAS